MLLLLALGGSSPAFAQFGSNATKLRGYPICGGVTPSSNQVLTYDGTLKCWKPAASGGGGSSYLNANTPATYTSLSPCGEVAADTISVSATSGLTGAASAIEVPSTLPSAGVPGTFTFTACTQMVESTQFTVSGSVASVYACFGRAGQGSSCEITPQFKLGQSAPNFQRVFTVNPIQGASTEGIVITFFCYNSSNALTNCGNGTTSSVTGGALQWTLSGVNNVQ